LNRRIFLLKRFQESIKQFVSIINAFLAESQ
jgi:hypothetical protein